MATRRDAAPAAAAPGQRIYFVSLGCPKNQADTELMLGQVRAAGHALVDAPEAADVIVVNTCAFIDAAKEESVDTILEMAQHKQSGARHSAYVKIAEGCDRPCAFCIIPKLRGPQRSRAIEDIVAEVRALAADGVLEVNLIAQDLTRYGWDAGSTPEARATLAQLLRALGRVDGVEWIRLHYTFPSAFDDELIDAIASEPRVVKYIDVPLQHISDAMLKRMRRGHSGRVTRELVAKLRARIDDVVLRTTFIVGHPGETETEFDELCEFVAESKFDPGGAFTYSVEPGTVFALLPHRVDPAVAAERQQTLMEIQRQISRTRGEAMVGREIDVLVEGESSESEHLMEGRWFGQAPGIDGVTYLTDGRG